MKLSIKKLILSKWKSTKIWLLMIKMNLILRISYLPYFKDHVARTRSKYETIMDPLSDKIQHLPEDKKKKYNKLIINIIAITWVECFI